MVIFVYTGNVTNSMTCSNFDCTRCPAINEPILYRCVDCYQDGITDCDMCDECKKEHIDANIGNKTKFIILF